MRGVLCYVKGMTTKHDKALTATWHEGYELGYEQGHRDGRIGDNSYSMGFKEGREFGYRQGVGDEKNQKKIVASNQTLHKTFSDYQKGYGQGVAHALAASSIAIIGGALIWVLVNA